MAARGDVKPFFEDSPRILEVASPSTQFVVQDIVDTSRLLETQFQGMSYPHLLNAAGKEDLGGGVSVGITATLQNAKIAFEGRTTPAQTGTVSTNPGTPVAGRDVFTDSSATFITNNVARGSIVINFTDQSIAEVVSVDSETQLTTKTLVNGIGNTYDVNDVYHVFNVVQCVASGGNLVAVDDVGSTISSVLPTAFTQVILTASSSGTISNIDQQILALQFLIESQRAEHRGYGDIFYWDPTLGSDSQTGTTPDKAVKTFAAAHALCTPNNSDVIFLLSTSGASLTVTERINITKNDVILRGPGSSVLFQPPDDTAPTITVTADNVSLSGFKAVSTGVTPQEVIKITGNAPRVADIWINGSTADGVHIENAEDAVVQNCTVELCAGDGIHFVDTINGKVFENRTQRNTGYGLSIEETTVCRDNWIARNNFHHNGPGSIFNGTGVSMTIITKDNYFGPRPGQPGGDDIVDNGVATHNEYQEFQDMVSDAVWNTVVEPQGNLTAKDVQNIGLAALAGRVTVSPDGNTVTFTTPDGAVTRIVSTTDAQGNRTNIVLTPAA